MTVAEAVQRSKTPTFMMRSSIKAAQSLISPSEEIVWAQVSNVYQEPVRGALSAEIGSVSDSLAGVIVVTNERILFVHKMLSNYVSKDIYISDIRSIDVKASLTYEVLRIVGTSDMIVTFAKRNIIAALRNAINQEIAIKSTAISPSFLQTTDDAALQKSYIEQLQALKQLYDSGVITAEEFAAKKAQILNL